MSMPIYTFTDSSSGSSIETANGGTLTAQAQDNPVETTLKYIYIIRNKINDKVYVGQSVNPKERFAGHIRDGKRTDKAISAIDGAIQKYGADNFYYEIIEGPTADYNNREKYWIWFFDSIAPKGYNIMTGGEDPPIMREFDNPSCKLRPKDIPVIIELLKNPYLTLAEIGKRFNCNFRIIKKINKGEKYRLPDVVYPIRNYKKSGDPNKVLPKDIVDHIISDILYTNISLRQIAVKYDVKVGVVYNINKGKSPTYIRENMSYPLRNADLKIGWDKVREIQKELQNGKLNKNQIAAKFGIEYSQVTAICSGRSYFDETLIYPLAPNEWQLGLSEEVIEETRKMLKRGESNKTIMTTLSLPNCSIINAINNGITHKSLNYSYPIRPPVDRIPVSQVREIESEIINTSLTFREIARKYNISFSSVQAINVGKWKRKYDHSKRYPLRPYSKSKKIK